ncbi:hypothetical protein GTO89_14200 [Heliobacterium gestii]|uniref:CvpA family protein n=1 Tax=Heliomicrobium gestii TaxID=2699 RepID=A0A845LMR9_HELGE|nr:CvpA family protein [Heliomicrobium gestii]MBM7867793.1 putative membrane protein required for colicin V production [Heliomicrobium gestii]MZP44186.1 hypothetical protein [Heliomicrobium gestii]
MNALDILIVSLIAFTFYRGYRRGLLASLLGVGAFFFVFPLATSLYKPLAELLDRQVGAVTALQGFFLQRFTPSLPAAQVRPDVAPSLNLERVLKDLPLPDFYKQEMARQLSDLNMVAPEGVRNLAELVANYVAHSVWNSIIFVLFFLVMALGVKMAVAGWIRLRGDGFIGRADKLLGGVLVSLTAWVVTAAVLSWFFAGPVAGASPLRVETQPLYETSRLMPYVNASNRWIGERFTGYTFR